MIPPMSTSGGPAPDLSDFPLLSDARAHWAANRLDAALEAFDGAVRERPRNVKALVEAARAFGVRHEIGRAEELLNRADGLAGADPRVAPVIAQSYRLLYRPHKAIELLERLRAGPAGLRPDMLAELATLYEQTDRVDEARAAIAECVARAPGHGEPLLVLARVERRRGDHGAAEKILLDLTSRAGAHPVLLVQAWGELCQLRDRQEDYDGAVEAIERAKSILRATPEAQRLSRQALVNNQVLGRIYAALDRATLAEWAGAELPADPRVSGVAHLLGFPRSGTTLLEQVLGAHPGLVDSPERVVFSRDIFKAMYRPTGAEPLTLDALRAIPPERLAAQRRRYLDYMEAALGGPLGGRVHLDKNPNHTSLMVGLYRLFPESRFIVALRDPRDVIVSAYLRNFNLTEFSACFLTWGSSCLIYAFETGVWLRLRALMEGNWLEVRYEDTVADVEGQARRALDFLRLPWDGSVMNYREANKGKVVNSPTHEAVREPVYTRAVGRWRHYEKHLGPYLDRLAPFVNAFGYE
jgi:tetratricopeptide (TPR) repeat protein